MTEGAIGPGESAPGEAAHPFSPCPCCATTRVAVSWRAREMMFGTREAFDYLECAECGTLRIARIPNDLSAFYPSAYYSFSPPPVRSGIRERMRRVRNRGAIRGDRLTGRILSRLMPYPERGVGEWVRLSGVGPESRVLDVGCGAGLLLVDFGDAGFRNLLGVDPFLPASMRHPNGVEVRRAALEEVEGSFDLIMLHHVLEHVASPLEMLEAVAARLAPGGRALVRLPTVSSEAWERYRERWVQLDPPRHLFVPSRAGMEALVRRAGLEVAECRDDSTDFQFTASEGYLEDIPLREQPLTGRWEAARLRRVAEALNREGRGDQVAYYLRRTESARGASVRPRPGPTSSDPGE